MTERTSSSNDHNLKRIAFWAGISFCKGKSTSGKASKTVPKQTEKRATPLQIVGEQRQNLSPRNTMSKTRLALSP